MSATIVERVLLAMKDGAPRTASQIATLAGISETQVTARIRDLRKPAAGSWNVVAERQKSGGYTYRLDGQNPAGTPTKHKKPVTAPNGISEAELEPVE